jgi:autotransporter translocation and assembly factor TamB
VVEIGNGIGVRGQIYATRGNLDILGRRYRIDRAIVDFDDGTIDPRLDVRVVHDFKNMTLTVDVGGRASKPRPRLTGDPGSYTEGQLLSFLAGAEPSDQSSTAQQSQAAVSGGLAILSGRIGRRINKYLPVKFDALSYEAGTASSSQAIRLGVQLSDKSYLVWRQHPAPRADENTGEAVFEYQLRSNMVFEATVGERSQGGDFLWRKRW